MNVAAHQKKKENKNTGKREAGEEENSRPISGRLCAPLCSRLEGSTKKV